MNNDNQNLEGKLVESIEAKELGSLTADYAELGLDALLGDGLAKDIPIVGTLIKAAKVGLNVRDRIYAKKIIGFLVQVGQTTQEQRDEFVKEYCGDVKRFEEAIHLILEQADRFEKTQLVGKIIKACILGKIRYEDSVRLSEMVNRAFWGDLDLMLSNKIVDVYEDHQSLLYSGLYSLKIDHKIANPFHLTGGVAQVGYPLDNRGELENVKCDISKYGKMLMDIANQ